MKLKNRKTGLVVELADSYMLSTPGGIVIGGKEYNTLRELNQDWEDFFEDRPVWVVDVDGEPWEAENLEEDVLAKCKTIGNGFATKEEAYLVSNKLRAWKKLSDKGFRFVNWTLPADGPARIVIEATCATGGISEELDLLFRRGENEEG